MQLTDARRANSSRPAWRGFIAHVAFALWFLLTALAARSAHAQEVQALTAADLLPSIEVALMAKGVSADAEVTLTDPAAAIAVAAGAEPQVEHVSVNSATGRFVIRINGTPIAGFAKVAVRYPVLVAPLARGDIITESNIEWLEEASARPGAVLDAEELVGKEARRALAAGSPLRASDVAAPILVKRGAVVTMSFVAAGLTLSEAGIAQATGGLGDVIDVKNVKSERVIRGVIEGKDRVRVLSARFVQAEQ
jgi:flagella basal body P-ring formation protein FlgA